MTSIQELKKKVEIKIKTLDLAVRENERILQRNKEKELQKHLLISENRQEEIQFEVSNSEADDKCRKYSGRD